MLEKIVDCHHTGLKLPLTLPSPQRGEGIKEEVIFLPQPIETQSVAVIEKTAGGE